MSSDEIPAAARTSDSEPVIVPKTIRNQALDTVPTLFDRAVRRQLEATHAHAQAAGGGDDRREFDVKPLLLVMRDIMHRSARVVGVKEQSEEGHNDNTGDAWDHRDIKLLADPINKTSSEMISKCSIDGGNAHSITLHLLQSLSNYSWEAKASIVLAAFAVKYGEFCLVNQTANPLAKSVALLKQRPETLMEEEEAPAWPAALKQMFGTVNDLVEAILDVIQGVIEFQELLRKIQCLVNDRNPPDGFVKHLSAELGEATAQIPTAVYWTMRTIVACSTRLLKLISLNKQYVPSVCEARELNILAQKLEGINDHQKKQLKRIENLHVALRNGISWFRSLGLAHVREDRRTPFRKTDDDLQLFDGTHNTRSGIDVLRTKHVLLLLSDKLDVSHEQLSILHQIYLQAREQPSRPESQFEVVWLPVVHRLAPWTGEDQKKFELLQNSMPWYSVADPMMRNSVIKLIKEEWAFDKKPQLVVLDPQGQKTNDNAFPMIWIWASLAFPFSKSREEALWGNEITWRIEFLADSIYPNLFLWISESRYICLYGGEDIEWIREFTTTARAVANAAGIPLEMLYVGKSNPGAGVRRNNSIIQGENLSHVLPDLTLIWFFWVRLENMRHSKTRHGMTADNDPIMQEIDTMLSFDGSGDPGWAVFSRGSHEMAKAKSGTVLQCMSQYDRWKDNVVYPHGFVIALNQQLQTDHH